MTDPIADMLTRIRNANTMKNANVTLPHSVIKEKISAILKDEGYISDYSVFEDGGFKSLILNLKYYGPNRERVISGLKRVSRPGLRVYVRSEKLPVVLNGLGIAIVSTSSGVVTDKVARQKGVGGEVLAMVW